MTGTLAGQRHIYTSPAQIPALYFFVCYHVTLCNDAPGRARLVSWLDQYEADSISISKSRYSPS